MPTLCVCMQHRLHVTATQTDVPIKNSSTRLRSHRLLCFSTKPLWSPSVPNSHVRLRWLLKLLPLDSQKKKEEIAVIVRRPAPGRCAHRVHGCARGSHGATTCTKDTPNPPLDHGRAGSPCLHPHPHSPIPTPQELQGAPKGHRRSRAAQWHLCTWPSGETTLPGQTNFF